MVFSALIRVGKGLSIQVLDSAGNGITRCDVMQTLGKVGANSGVQAAHGGNEALDI